MYDKASNKFYFEVSENNSPETIKQSRAALDYIGKNDLPEGAAVQMLNDVQLSVLSNCVSVSKYIDVTLMANTINGLNSTIKTLLDVCEMLAGGLSIHNIIEDSEGITTLEALTKEEKQDLIYDLVDSARDELFAVRQTVVELCSE